MPTTNETTNKKLKGIGIENFLTEMGDKRNLKGAYPVGNKHLVDWATAVGANTLNDIAGGVLSKFGVNPKDGAQLMDTAKARKAVANHLWYMANKAKKQQYNQQYYLNNIEYWRKRYKQAREDLSEDVKNQYKKGKDVLSDARKELESEKKKFMAEANNEDDIRDMEREAEMVSQFIDNTEKVQDAKYKEDLKFAKEVEAIYADNLNRAHREYQEFLDSQKKMSVGEAWKLGAKGIVNAGRSFINKLLGR